MFIGEGDGEMDGQCKIFCGDSLQILQRWPEESVQCCVTSPPYWRLRDYGCDGQMGLEANAEEYVGKMVEVFREVRRVLRRDGTLWLNVGDSYGERKQLQGIPWRLAFAMQHDGWLLRQDIIWHKPNAMPESIKDRCTKAHEYLFLLSKSERYYFDHKALMEPATVRSPGNKSHKYADQYAETEDQLLRTKQGMMQIQAKDMRFRRSVWSIATKGLKEAHFAVMPLQLAQDCVIGGCPEGGLVIDPFMGAGTVAVAAEAIGRKWAGIELNPEYVRLATDRILEERRKLGIFAPKE